MSDFIYACVQLVHNLGAAAVVGGPAVSWWLARASLLTAAFPGNAAAIFPIQRKLAWLTLVAWSAQLASGAGFGATTYYLKHAFPELTGIGLAALVIKVSCAVIAFTLILLYLTTGSRWSAKGHLRAWQALFTVGITALMSAAFLRWYA